MDTSRRALLALALVSAGVARPGRAQRAYPSRPIRLVVAWAPTGSIDTVARKVAQKLSEQLIPGRLMSKLPVCPCGCKPVQAYFGSVENQVLVSRHS